ncbi:MAG: glutamate--cysteine ligase [Alphaproteobacteria bacterium]|nr:glutamate--cysteine ligase [Alphaproteobacteria bacterium]
MGQEIDSAAFSEHDFAEFQQKLDAETALLQGMFDTQLFAQAQPMVGMELEAWLVDKNFAPVAEYENFIAKLSDPLVGPELSQYNFELNNTPQTLNSDGKALLHIAKELSATWDDCVRNAENLGLHAVAIGIIPTLRDQMLTKNVMAISNRYHALNQQLFSMRGNTPLSFHIDEGESLHVEQADIMLEAAATSLQVHFQVGQRAAVRTYNASIIASAACVAISANAPYLYGRALWEETRIAVFERAVPSGNLRDKEGKVIGRVGFGSGYAQDSLFEAFAENLSGYPPILPVTLEEDKKTLPHLRLHNGTIWRWNRPLVGFDSKTGKASLRIEHRTMSAGPTISDTMANIAFYLGLTHALATQNTPPETMLAFAQAKDNFYDAAKYGLAANVQWLDGATHNLQQLCAEVLIPLARQGLEALHIDEASIVEYIDNILAPRIKNGKTGAAWQKAYIAEHGTDFAAMTGTYIKQQATNIPVHLWQI